MEFLSYFLKTLATLDLHAEKKRQIPNGSSKYFIYWSIYELFYNSARKNQKLKQPAYQSNEFQFFQQEVGKFIFPSKFKWGSFFCDSRSKIDISEKSLKLLKNLHCR